MTVDVAFLELPKVPPTILEHQLPHSMALVVEQWTVISEPCWIVYFDHADRLALHPLTADPAPSW